MNEDKAYHHGDLRNKLIESGIQLVSENGINGFSLRKVATRCGVSHAAPYAHFKNVDALLSAMGEHVTKRFIEKLHNAVQKTENSRTAVTALGEAYIAFFSKNPHYFSFLFDHSGVSIDLDNTENINYPPFDYFRDVTFKMLEEMGIPTGQRTKNMLALWSMVHGIAALLTNKSVQYTGNWTEVLTNNIFTGGK